MYKSAECELYDAYNQIINPVTSIDGSFEGEEFEAIRQEMLEYAIIDSQETIKETESSLKHFVHCMIINNR